MTQGIVFGSRMFGAGIRMREVMEMVQKVLVSLIDDLDGKPADETVQSGSTKINFGIDLRRREEAARASAAIGQCRSANRRISPTTRCRHGRRINRPQAKRRHP